MLWLQLSGNRHKHYLSGIIWPDAGRKNARRTAGVLLCTFALLTLVRKQTLVCYIRQQRNLTGALDRDHQLTLMLSADTSRSARENFASLGNKSADFRRILIIYRLALINTELTYFSALAAMASAILLVSQSTNLQSLRINHKWLSSIKICAKKKFVRTADPRRHHPARQSPSL
jgi:hypothetical protein